jgi:hypothetical protein
LSDDEKVILAQFKVHKEGFEYNKLSKDRNPMVPPFPEEIIKILN